MSATDDRERRRTEPLPFDLDNARAALREYFASQPEVDAAFLFGSRARGSARPSSDVDIAVWVDPAVTSARRAGLRWEWLRRLPDLLGYAGDVDLLILNDATPPLAWDVACSPVVLYEASADRASEIAFRLRRAYRDEFPRLERRRRRLFERIERGEFGVRRQSR